MKHHDLKLKAVFFQAKLSGLKPWEIRTNDRGFKVGDTVTFHEVEPNYYSELAPDPTGRVLGPCTITYITYSAGELIPDGVCIFTHGEAAEPKPQEGGSDD